MEIIQPIRNLLQPPGSIQPQVKADKDHYQLNKYVNFEYESVLSFTSDERKYWWVTVYSSCPAKSHMLIVPSFSCTCVWSIPTVEIVTNLAGLFFTLPMYF